jgi:hypothetical protein
MLSSGSLALIGFGAVLTSVSATAGSIVAGLGVLWEAFIFYRSGTGDAL